MQAGTAARTVSVFLLALAIGLSECTTPLPTLPVPASPTQAELDEAPFNDGCSPDDDDGNLLWVDRDYAYLPQFDQGKGGLRLTLQRDATNGMYRVLAYATRNGEYYSDDHPSVSIDNQHPDALTLLFCSFIPDDATYDQISGQAFIKPFEHMPTWSFVMWSSQGPSFRSRAAYVYNMDDNADDYGDYKNVFKLLNTSSSAMMMTTWCPDGDDASVLVENYANVQHPAVTATVVDVSVTPSYANNTMIMVAAYYLSNNPSVLHLATLAYAPVSTGGGDPVGCGPMVDLSPTTAHVLASGSGVDSIRLRTVPCVAELLLIWPVCQSDTDPCRDSLKNGTLLEMPQVRTADHNYMVYAVYTYGYVNTIASWTADELHATGSNAPVAGNEITFLADDAPDDPITDLRPRPVLVRKTGSTSIYSVPVYSPYGLYGDITKSNNVPRPILAGAETTTWGVLRSQNLVGWNVNSRYATKSDDTVFLRAEVVDDASVFNGNGLCTPFAYGVVKCTHTATASVNLLNITGRSAVPEAASTSTTAAATTTDNTTPNTVTPSTCPDGQCPTGEECKDGECELCAAGMYRNVTTTASCIECQCAGDDEVLLQCQASVGPICGSKTDGHCTNTHETVPTYTDPSARWQWACKFPADPTCPTTTPVKTTAYFYGDPGWYSWSSSQTLLAPVKPNHQTITSMFVPLPAGTTGYNFDFKMAMQCVPAGSQPVTALPTAAAGGQSRSKLRRDLKTARAVNYVYIAVVAILVVLLSVQVSIFKTAYSKLRQCLARRRSNASPAGGDSAKVDTATFMSTRL